MTRNWPLWWIGIWLAASALVGLFYSGDHVLTKLLSPGRDAFGRPLHWVVLQASAFSLLFAASATLVSVAIGVLAGAGLALAPPWAKNVGIQALEFTLAFPSLLIALAWAAIWGPGYDTLIVALTIGTLPAFTRLMYLRATEVQTQEFVTAARSMGATRFQILRKHLAPHLLSVARVKTPNLFAHALLAEATLSFVGVGAPIGTESWGSLLAQGQEYLIEAPQIAFFTGFPLVITILALQKLSEQPRGNLRYT